MTLDNFTKYLKANSMEIVVMENNIITKKGKGVLMLCSEDYKAYVEKLKDKNGNPLTALDELKKSE